MIRNRSHIPSSADKLKISSFGGRVKTDGQIAIIVLGFKDLNLKLFNCIYFIKEKLNNLLRGYVKDNHLSKGKKNINLLVCKYKVTVLAIQRINYQPFPK